MNKRLIRLLGGSMRHVRNSVVMQWLGLLASILFAFAVAILLQKALLGGWAGFSYWALILVLPLCILARHLLARRVTMAGFAASRSVKKTLRSALYKKLQTLGPAYHERVPTAEATQLCTEGVEQLETYFGAFLPQLFYSVLAPLTLFVVMVFLRPSIAVVLLVLVPVIPLAIMGVQKLAKKLLSRYWGQYARLGDTFLESLQGLTTLKIYNADGRKAEKMAGESENFRKVTMKVLTMQLNSITLMDLVAYGGAAIGVCMALAAFWAGQLPLWGCVAFILLSAEFFLPLRALGSYFHTAMNGMAASDKMFRILDIDIPQKKGRELGEGRDIEVQNLTFGYKKDRPVLQDINLAIPAGSFVAVVGESGSGKSTLAGILMGENTGYRGAATIGGIPLAALSEAALMGFITRVRHNSSLFRGTVRDNLRIARPGADDEALWQALSRVKLAPFLRGQQGLDTKVAEDAANLSGGQRQRLALARALLHDSPVYIFDEATSNIDVESENDIMDVIRGLARRKTVIMISHRLANVTGADCVYVLEGGRLAGRGRHEELLAGCLPYRRMWDYQQGLEQYGLAYRSEHATA